MPDRIIRDELLDSERYVDLPTDSHRLLFVHLMLLADDLGNVEAGSGYLRRRAACGATAAAISGLLSTLADADLIRLYMVDGKQYAHIPRFRQRLRSYKRAHPRPPVNVECNEIKELMFKVTDTSQPVVGHLSDKCQSLAGEEKGREGKGREEEPPTPSAEGVPAKKRSKASVDALSVELPDWLPTDAWNDFLAFRRNDKRDPVSELAARRLIGKLAELRDAGNDPRAVIDQSIASGWKGFFELKRKAGSQSKPPTEEKYDL